MQVHQLTASECREALDRHMVARLSCTQDGIPYVVPMRFAYDGTYLYGFSLPGQKIEWMRANPRVCVEFDELASHYEWTTLIASGRYEELPDTPEFDAARVQALGALQKLAMWWQPAAERPDRTKPFAPIFFRIRVTHLSGHRATPEPVESVSMRGRKSIAGQLPDPGQRHGGVIGYLAQLLGARGALTRRSESR